MPKYKTKQVRDHQARETATRTLLTIFGNYVISKQKNLLPFKIFGYCLVKPKPISPSMVDRFEKYLQSGKD